MRHGNFAAYGGDVHDTSPTPKTHLGHDLRNQFVRRPKMQSHRAVVIFTAHVIERTDFDGAGVVDQDVNPVEMIDDFPDSGLNLIAIEQIAFDGENVSAARSEIGFRTREFFWITREESNLAALTANVSRQHETESTRSATDQDNFFAQWVLRRANDASSYPAPEQKSACSEPHPSIHLHDSIIRYEAFGASGRETDAPLKPRFSTRLIGRDFNISSHM